MSKKIGRNELCPCGSGKKYKRCCMNVEQTKDRSTQINYAHFLPSGLDAPKIKSYLKEHTVVPLMDYLIALQLNPQNHGKNIRFEHISQLIVSSLGEADAIPDVNDFKSLLDDEFSMDLMEDMPINMFTETVVFHGGNYIFFPGLSTDAAELFRAMTEAIYYRDNIFPEFFRGDIYQGVRLLLELGTLIAKRAGIERMTRGNDDPREPISRPLTTHSYAISKQMMAKILGDNKLGEESLIPFLLDKNDPNLLIKEADRNPILYRPIIEYNGNYYFIGITNQGCAINNFILKTAIKHNCLSELVHQTQRSIWMRIGVSCIDKMHWRLSSFNDLLQRGSHYDEELFQIDDNWLAYVCYVKDTASDVSVDGFEGYAHLDIDTYLKSTLVRLRCNDKTKDFHILTFVLYSSMGESFGLKMEERIDSDYLLLFPAFEFLQLVQTEKWDNMSLVRFARTWKTKPCLNTLFNQLIDVYSLYKHYGESFYISDKAEPDYLQIMPNDGCPLIFESKEKLNFHGTPLTVDGKYAYIPVQRDMNYTAIYKPVHPSINAKICESYSVPIWVRCSQTEKPNSNPSSIIDTIITAIAFWMDRLRPCVEKLLIACYKQPIEIELIFSEDALSDNQMQTEEIQLGGEGTLNVTKTSIGLSVFLDRDFIRSFMGANNSSERELMRRIIMALLSIDDKTSTAIIDERMPLGPAKMILMMETSNSPMSCPLWLTSPIFIHPATSQLLLDHFPEWMKNKGYDINTQLKTKQQKIDFLHNGVDVLLEALAKKTSVFDICILLKMLISNHETLVFQREHNKILNPAQILCFGDTREKRDEFYANEGRLTESGLATRALIEFLAATQDDNSAKMQPGSDDVESLLAIMSEIVRVGSICDAIHFDVANHIIKKLQSGRYGIYDEDFSDSLGDFTIARSAESVNFEVENFGHKMESLSAHNLKAPIEKSKECDYIDKAFLSDWGISYTDILQFLYACYIIGIEKQSSVVEIAESEMVIEIKRLASDMSENAIIHCLNRLSLDKRDAYLTPPVGFEKREIFPWIYNRELSFLRRPIIRYQMSNGKSNCIYGIRSCIMAGIQLSNLLFSGRLRNTGKHLSKLLGSFEAEKGMEFNEEVRAYLQQIPDLKVWSHDVSIRPKGNLLAEADYGDIDVLAYDASRNILYSIECKNTNTAKNIREMKTEMDEYLGRGEKPDRDQKRALVLKHLRRHKWILEHMDKVRCFIGASSQPTVKSMMLTASVIPTSYLKKEITPLSILNFQELKIQGQTYLDSSKDPIFDRG